jgi:short subunit dehydrogenase-like uncharacterized protein
VQVQREIREYDVIVWGASGFTGRLVVEYLLKRYPLGGDLRWAVAGRNKAKLQQLLGEQSETPARPSIIVADSHDQDSLDRLASSTRVILTTVGPYAIYGSELVAACVRNGTHYCDLCGEVQWMRQMIDKYQAAAEKSGARVVMSCGFDSIPSDMGLWFLQQQALEKYGRTCTDVTLLVRAMKGGASGGTYASMLNAIEQARSDPNIAKILIDPYALNPAGEHKGPDRRDQRGPAYNRDAGVWTAPFVMAGVNTRVVRRSHALQGYPYGNDFLYHEAMWSGPGIRGRIKAMSISTGLSLFMIACAIQFTRRNVIERLLPRPGQGPTRQQRESGYFNLLLLGKIPGGDMLGVRVKGDRDPGYGSTSKMLAESAVCLAIDEALTGGGFWTPSTAMGALLMKRLTERAGLSFEVD